jgi:hypothetical protein
MERMVARGFQSPGGYHVLTEVWSLDMADREESAAHWSLGVLHLLQQWGVIAAHRRAHRAPGGELSVRSWIDGVDSRRWDSPGNRGGQEMCWVKEMSHSYALRKYKLEKTKRTKLQIS